MYGRIPFQSPYQGSGAPWTRDKKCKACGEVIKPSKNIYGSGRFCSDLCNNLRTPERHMDWLKDHPEEYKAWQERRNKTTGALGPDPIVFPVA